MPCSTRAKHFYGMNAFREDLDYDLHELDPRVARQGATVRRPLRPSCNDLALWLGRSRVTTRASSIGRACSGPARASTANLGAAYGSARSLISKAHSSGTPSLSASGEDVIACCGPVRSCDDDVRQSTNPLSVIG
jgi:hypothetical protein